MIRENPQGSIEALDKKLSDLELLLARAFSEATMKNIEAIARKVKRRRP